MKKSEYLSWFHEVLAPTRPMFELVEPDMLDWRPTEGSFSVGQLLSHIPRSISFNVRVLKQEGELPSMRQILISNRRHTSATREEALALLEDAVRSFREAVEMCAEETFQTDLVVTPQRGTIPVWRFCVFVLEHHIHHLMELHLSLKILGVPVDTRTLYAGS